MTRTATIVVAAALAVAGFQTAARAQAMAQATTAADHSAAEKLLAANEAKINQAYVKADIATLKTFIADEGVAVDKMGVMGVAEMYAMLPTANIKVTEQSSTGFKFVWVDTNTVVVTYTWNGKGTAMGQPVTPTYMTTVWTKRAGRWVAVFHQETGIAPAPPKK